MLGEDQALSVCEEALRRAAADQAEAVLMADDEGLTRYANSTIHQNVAEVNATLNLSVALGKRVGVASGNDLSPAGLARLADQALEVARGQPPNHDFPGLPGPAPLPAIPPPDAAVVTCPPERRAEFVLAVIRRARAAGLEAAGAFTTSASELAVANALGLRTYSASSPAHLTAVIVGPDGSGYADATAWALAGVHAAAVAEEAVERAQRVQGPAEIEPGSYDVVLEPYAVSELLDYLAYAGFSALAGQEGRSFLATSLGQPVASPPSPSPTTLPTREACPAPATTRACPSSAWRSSTRAWPLAPSTTPSRPPVRAAAPRATACQPPTPSAPSPPTWCWPPAMPAASSSSPRWSGATGSPACTTSTPSTRGARSSPA